MRAKIKLEFVKQKRLAANTDKFVTISDKAMNIIETAQNDKVLVVTYCVKDDGVHLIDAEPITAEQWLEKVFG